MIEELVHFNSGGLRLEGVLSYKEDLVNPPMVLICPPHPNLGGDIENNVILALANELSAGGYVTLRFNYRGVGGSEGPFKTVADKFSYWESTFGEGNLEGPLEDTASALSFLRNAVSEGEASESFIVGYSFGAVLGMKVGARDEGVRGLAGIATPCAAYDLTCLARCKIPKLFICSGHDFATSVEETTHAFENFSEPKGLVVKRDVSHFYIGSEKEVAREVSTFFNRVRECGNAST